MVTYGSCRKITLCLGLLNESHNSFLYFSLSHVRSSSSTAASVSVRLWSVALRHESNGCIAFCVARRPEGLLAAPEHGLTSPASAPKSLATQLPIWRLYAAGRPFSSRPRRSRWVPSDVSRLHILSHCSRPYHPAIGSRPHPGHHSRYHGTRLTDPTGYPASVVCRPSPPITSDQWRQFDLNSFAPWPSCVVFSSNGQLHIIPQLTASWNDFTGR
jgi:hypothetical protein